MATTQDLNQKESTTRMSAEDEMMLAKLAAEGNNRAFDKLITANMGFVINLAKEYQGQGVDFEDLISEGSIALMMAIKKWNPEKTGRLVQYAVWDIRKAMELVIERQATVVRVPEGESQHVKSIDAPLRQGHTRSLGETMTDKDQASTSDATDNATASIELEESLDVLSERERTVIVNFYAIGCPGLTMAEIGEKMGLKRERVRQIRKKAERKLRRPLR